MKNTLSARDALNIAAQYGFSIRRSPWERKMIRDAILDARASCEQPNLVNGWPKSAIQHFDERMARAAAGL